MTDNQREAFEKLIIANNTHQAIARRIYCKSRYLYSDTQNKWLLWQAAQKQLAEALVAELEAARILHDPFYNSGVNRAISIIKQKAGIE